MPCLFRHAFFSNSVAGVASQSPVTTYAGCRTVSSRVATARRAEPDSLRTRREASEKLTSRFSLRRHSFTSLLNDVHVLGLPSQVGMFEWSSDRCSLAMVPSHDEKDHSKGLQYSNGSLEDANRPVSGCSPRAAGQLLASFPDDHRSAMVPVLMGRRRGAGHGRWPYWGPGWGRQSRRAERLRYHCGACAAHSGAATRRATQCQPCMSGGLSTRGARGLFSDSIGQGA